MSSQFPGATSGDYSILVGPVLGLNGISDGTSVILKQAYAKVMTLYSFL